MILSLENHCNLENQKKMAEYLEEILGGILCESYDDCFPFSI